MIRDWLAAQELVVVLGRFMTVVGVGTVVVLIARWLFRAGGPFNR